MPRKPQNLQPRLQPSVGSTKGLVSNWHYLLSNRVDGFSSNGTTIGVNENTSKSTIGHTVVTPTFINSSIGSTFEVTFNNSLNPAIITACKSLEELDLYLDCLESNSLDKFEPFDIKYEVLPFKQ